MTEGTWCPRCVRGSGARAKRGRDREKRGRAACPLVPQPSLLLSPHPAASPFPLPLLPPSALQDDLNTTLDTFRDRFGDAPKREDLTILAPRQDDPTDQVFVFFPDEAKVGVKGIKAFAERMRSEAVFRAVVVAQAAMTPFARQCLTEMAPKYTIEVVR